MSGDNGLQVGGSCVGQFHIPLVEDLLQEDVISWERSVYDVMEQLGDVCLDGIIPRRIIPKNISRPVATPLSGCLVFYVLQLAVVTSIIKSIFIDSFVGIKLLFG